eukprot:TRINITY_DN7261_c0_g1_i1.p1 TRINITY_DN7261_c0_g1~~TRINITY_DN7261_c0_g1_i1.p1  ORF type:complete len:171 (+),score=18.32 TRINITY_DN7261_c0_g1_i1:448-960(+)
MVLTEDEAESTMRALRTLPIETDTLAPSPKQSEAIRDAVAQVPDATKVKAYQSWLGNRNSNRGLRWSKPHLVVQANKMAVDFLGWPDAELPPPINAVTVGKMGLKGVPGLNLTKGPSASSNTKSTGAKPTRNQRTRSTDQQRTTSTPEQRQQVGAPLNASRKQTRRRSSY